MSAYEPQHWLVPPALAPGFRARNAASGVRAIGHTIQDCAACAALRLAREAAAAPAATKRTPASTPAWQRRRRDPGKLFTVRETILLAAGDVADTDGVVRFGALVVAAWKRSPAAFGLNDHAHTHPHAGRVQAKLSGADSLLTRGWLEGAGTLTWRLTKRGARMLRELQHPKYT